MKVIKPVTLTDAMLVSTTVGEVLAAWLAPTAYALGVQVRHGKRIYQSLQAGNTGHTPGIDDSAGWWVDAGPSNTWAMFDQEVNTQSTQTGSGLVEMTVTIAPGLIGALSLLEIMADEVQVQMRSASGAVIYTQDLSMDGAVLADWYDYFFLAPSKRTSAVLLDLPPYDGCRLTITLRGQGEVRLGALILGNAVDLGRTRLGGRLGITDYSKKTTNDWGAVTIVRRAFSKTAQFSYELPTADLDRVYEQLQTLRATPCVWMGYDVAICAATTVFGFYKEFSIDLALSKMNYCSLSIEGMI